MMSMYRDSDGKTIIDIKDCETMREVKILKMGNLGLTEFDTQLLSQLDNLEEMDISRNQVESIPNVVRLPRLRRLDCSQNRLSDLGFVGQFPRLVELNVEGNNLTFADFCIASFLCPKLKSVNGQVINIAELNQMIESRMKPKIHQIWSDHMGQIYHYSMSDDEFSALSDKFRLLIAAILKPSSKMISKFQDFRITRMVDDFLDRIRKEEVIEFGGSEETVKRNYAKKRTNDVPADPTLITGSSSETIGNTEVKRPEDCVVMAVADEHGNGVVPVEYAASLIASGHLQNGTCLNVLVETVSLEPTPAFREVPSVVAVTDTRKDFIEEESERLSRTSLETQDAHGGAMQTNGLQRKTGKASEARSADKLDEKQKVVRYWVYGEEASKSKFSSGQQDTECSTNVSSNVGRRPRTTARKAMRELLAQMKSKGTLPDAPKIKMPSIDVQQAARLVFDIKRSPMVVYRGRPKKDNRGCTRVRLLPVVKRTATAAQPPSRSTDYSAIDEEDGTVDSENILTMLPPAPQEAPSQELANGRSEAVSEPSVRESSTTTSQPQAPLLPQISENHFPPKKRVRFIDANLACKVKQSVKLQF